MATMRVAVSREQRSPVRVQTWNATLRAGDDFLLAITVYRDDSGEPANLTGARSRLALYPERPFGYGTSPDYGLGWYTGAKFTGWPTFSVPGFITNVRPGGVNFAMTAAQTLTLIGRYRLIVQVDQLDGSLTELEGVLQVREGWNQPVDAFGHGPFGPYFELDASVLDGSLPLIPNGYGPIDPDGFFTLTGTWYPPLPVPVLPPGEGILGQGFLNEIELVFSHGGGSAVLGDAILGDMILGQP